MEATVARCEEIVAERAYAQHMALNVAKLVACRDDELLRSAVENSAIVNADGAGRGAGPRACSAPACPSAWPGST